MITYKISFYPGITLPKPYYVTSSKPPTDYQGLLDTLVDEQLSGFDWMFDDEEECNDDEIVIAGNNSRRLRTGGMLDISEVTSDDICALLQEKAGTDYPFGVMYIYFGDKVNICFEAPNITALATEWKTFCDENDLNVMDITSIEFPVRNKQIHTERGIIWCVGSFTKEDIAREAGFEYAFFSNELNATLYNRIIDEKGNRREFVLVTE